jgi:hypothetical protein
MKLNPSLNHLRSCFMVIRETPHVDCFQMAVTITVVTKNVCMSRRWKYDQVAYRICNQASTRFTHLRPINLRFHFFVQSVQNQFSTVT